MQKKPYISISPIEITKATNLFAYLKHYRCSLTHESELMLEEAYERHILTITNNLEDKINNELLVLNENQLLIQAEVIMATYGLFDASMQQLITICDRHIPEIANSINDIRDIHSHLLTQLYKLINESHKKMEDIDNKLRGYQQEMEELRRDKTQDTNKIKVLQRESEINQRAVLELRSQMKELTQETNRQSTNTIDSSYRRFQFSNEDMYASSTNKSKVTMKPRLPHKSQPTASKSSTNQTKSNTSIPLQPLENHIYIIRKDIQNYMDFCNIVNIPIIECYHIIETLYHEKKQWNNKCLNAKNTDLTLETIEQFIYRKYEQTYGLRSIAITHISKLLKSVMNYCQEDIFQSDHSYSTHPSTDGSNTFHAGIASSSNGIVNTRNCNTFHVSSKIPMKSLQELTISQHDKDNSIYISLSSNDKKLLDSNKKFIKYETNAFKYSLSSSSSLTSSKHLDKKLLNNQQHLAITSNYFQIFLKIFHNEIDEDYYLIYHKLYQSSIELIKLQITNSMKTSIEDIEKHMNYKVLIEDKMSNLHNLILYRHEWKKILSHLYDEQDSLKIDIILCNLIKELERERLISIQLLHSKQKFQFSSIATLYKTCQSIPQVKASESFMSTTGSININRLSSSNKPNHNSTSASTINLITPSRLGYHSSSLHNNPFVSPKSNTSQSIHTPSKSDYIADSNVSLKLPFQIFMNIVFQYQLDLHETYIENFRQIFNQYDNDNDGILNIHQFYQCFIHLRNVYSINTKSLQEELHQISNSPIKVHDDNPLDETEIFAILIKLIDPLNKDVIPFSHAARILNKVGYYQHHTTSSISENDL